jgi:hypothetical protein
MERTRTAAAPAFDAAIRLSLQLILFSLFNNWNLTFCSIAPDAKSTALDSQKLAEWLYGKTLGHPYFLAFISRELWSHYHTQPLCTTSDSVRGLGRLSCRSSVVFR